MTTKNYFWQQYTAFNGHILLSTVICYFWQLYTTFDDYILLLRAIYYIRRLYITFDGYILLLALPYYDFARMQVFPAISFNCGLNTKPEFLALIQFCFFCSSMVFHGNFNLPFWKRCFTRSTQMLKIWSYQTLKKVDLDIFNWIKPCYSNCNVS